MLVPASLAFIILPIVTVILRKGYDRADREIEFIASLELVVQVVQHAVGSLLGNKVDDILAPAVPVLVTDVGELGEYYYAMLPYRTR